MTMAGAFWPLSAAEAEMLRATLAPSSRLRVAGTDRFGWAAVTVGVADSVITCEPMPSFQSWAVLETWKVVCWRNRVAPPSLRSQMTGETESTILHPTNVALAFNASHTSAGPPEPP